MSIDEKLKAAFGSQVIKPMTPEQEKELLDAINKSPPGGIIRVPEGVDPRAIFPPILLKFKKLRPDATIPTRSFEAACYDLYMCDLTESGRPNKIVLPPHATSRPIPTGIAVELPPGHVGLVCSRSGLASQGVFVANGPGIIDPDFRGELKVLLYNGGHQSRNAVHGDRVAQLMIVPFITPPLMEVEELSPTERGENGMGSTGQ
jgi:dUTP pyrophosphatase